MTLSDFDAYRERLAAAAQADVPTWQPLTGEPGQIIRYDAGHLPAFVVWRCAYCRSENRVLTIAEARVLRCCSCGAPK